MPHAQNTIVRLYVLKRLSYTRVVSFSCRPSWWVHGALDPSACMGASLGIHTNETITHV